MSTTEQKKKTATKKQTRSNTSMKHNNRELFFTARFFLTLAVLLFFPFCIELCASLEEKNQKQLSKDAVVEVKRNNEKVLQLIPKGFLVNGIVSKQHLKEIVSSTWSELVQEHDFGLKDVKDKTASPTHLSEEEASYHYEAVNHGVVDSARFLITFGVVPSLVNVNSDAIYFAILNDDLLTLEKHFARRGEEKKREEENKISYIHAAVALNKLEAARIILKHRPDWVDTVENVNHLATPLMLAASLNNLAMMQLLVNEFNANVLAQHAFGKNTALHFASEQNSLLAIQFLCEKGGQAIVNSKSATGECCCCCCSFVTSLFTNSPEWIVGATALHIAADSNRPESVEALIKHCQGVNVNSNSLNNGTAWLCIVCM